MEEGEDNNPGQCATASPFCLGWSATAAVAQCWECTVGEGGDAAPCLLPIALHWARFGGGGVGGVYILYIIYVSLCTSNTSRFGGTGAK